MKTCKTAVVILFQTAGCRRGSSGGGSCRRVRWCRCHDPRPLHRGWSDQVRSFFFAFSTSPHFSTWIMKPLKSLLFIGRQFFSLQCTNSFIRRTLNEVKRVLKPGGKFYYMEHIIAQEVTITVVMRQTFYLIMIQGRPLRYIQQALMFGGWKIFCMVNGDLTFGG